MGLRYRFKMMKWWLQSFLIGIEDLVCGFRDDVGTVHRLEKFSISAMPTYCKVVMTFKSSVCYNVVLATE